MFHWCTIPVPNPSHEHIQVYIPLLIFAETQICPKTGGAIGLIGTRSIAMDVGRGLPISMSFGEWSGWAPSEHWQPIWMKPALLVV